METQVSTKQGTFTDADFDRVSSLYGNDEDGTKFRRLVDVLASIDPKDRQNALSRADTVFGHLDDMVERGVGYTPPKDKGFGSDNAAVIGAKIRGTAQTVGSTRKAFSDFGKTVRS